MVHLDIETPSDKRVRVAADIAAQFNATLIGITAAAPRPPLGGEGVIVAELLEREEQELQSQLAAQEKAFRRLTKSSKRPAEWRAMIDLPSEAVARETRAADLVVIGRDRVSGDIYRSLDPGSVLLRAGRPVVIVPPHVAGLKAKRVLIAWQDSREARRALQDALPFLHNIDEVLVTEICDERGKDTGKAHVEDVAKYLLRHRIVASAGVMLKASGSVTDELLRVVERERVDLVVAGAYGHSRVGEWIFGGVTRDLLTRSPVCCLLSN
jgi:nucleotide-binding universal stress UspA family protein